MRAQATQLGAAVYDEEWQVQHRLHDACRPRLRLPEAGLVYVAPYPVGNVPRAVRGKQEDVVRHRRATASLAYHENELRHRCHRLQPRTHAGSTSSSKAVSGRMSALRFCVRRSAGTQWQAATTTRARVRKEALMTQLKALMKFQARS
eukprot:scaffold34109_cov73-Phaeocystis_antarctica.AAC.6